MTPTRPPLASCARCASHPVWTGQWKGREGGWHVWASVFSRAARIHPARCAARCCSPRPIHFGSPQAEIKHGRVAMAGFVGYIVHANDIRIPGDKIAASIPTGLAPQALWDSIPEAAKWQIILTIGFFEFWRENSYILETEGQKHYMRGGKPGYFPTFDALPHPVPLNLFDPFGFSKNASPEKKAAGLIKEINNGRLAQYAASLSAALRASRVGQPIVSVSDS